MSKRSRACEISQKVKEIVWNRDNHKCIYCERYVQKTFANAHFIKRSQGGLGIPENIVTLCSECHYQEDFGQDTIIRRLYRKLFKRHLWRELEQRKINL